MGFDGCLMSVDVPIDRCKSIALRFAGGVCS